jgi:hypothetical protein
LIRKEINLQYYLEIMQVAASLAAESALVKELKQWNELYGEGGSQKKKQLTYIM